jgi:hypothetical protein
VALAASAFDFRAGLLAVVGCRQATEQAGEQSAGGRLNGPASLG